MKALIVAAGEAPSGGLLEKRLAECGLAVAVDGGAQVFADAGLLPDAVIGDMDSANAETIDAFRAAGSRFVVSQREKNETDTHIALLYLIEQGYGDILLLGATGGRIDHLLANIMLLKLALEKGVRLVIEDGLQTIEIVQGNCTIRGEEGQTVSLLPADTDALVNSEGLYYPLDDLLLSNSGSRGISNVMCGREAKIQTDNPLLVVKIKDASC